MNDSFVIVVALLFGFELWNFLLFKMLDNKINDLETKLSAQIKANSIILSNHEQKLFLLESELKKGD